MKEGIDSFIGSLKEEKCSLSTLDVHPVKQGLGKKAATTMESKARVGASGRKGPSKFSADQTDKIYQLEAENNELKLKENTLTSEIGKMKTKLRRIDELLRKKGKSSSNYMMPEEVQAHLQDEIDVLITENEHIKERNKKLKVIESDMTQSAKPKKAPPKPANKFSHVKGKLGSQTMKESDQQFQKMCEDLRKSNVACNREIIRLTTMRDQLQEKFGSVAHSGQQLEIDSL